MTRTRADRTTPSRGVTLLEADTDGVYFAVPAGWTVAEERAVGLDEQGLHRHTRLARDE